MNDADKLKLAAIAHKYKVGLIDRNSDLYFIYTKYKELENEKLAHNRGVDQGVKKVVRKSQSRRPQKGGVRPRDYNRTKPSTTKDFKLEGG